MALERKILTTTYKDIKNNKSTSPVCFTRPHGTFLVLYSGTNQMGGPPSLCETGTYILYMSSSSLHDRCYHILTHHIESYHIMSYCVSISQLLYKIIYNNIISWHPYYIASDLLRATGGHEAGPAHGTARQLHTAVGAQEG